MALKFSMNGWRRQLSTGVQELRDIAQAIKDGDHYDEDDLDAAINELICLSNCINCVSIEGDKDFKDMSDLEVALMSEDETQND